MQMIFNDFLSNQNPSMESIINFSFTPDLFRWKQNVTKNSYDILIVNQRDSKNKRCRDQDFSRTVVIRGVRTKTFQNQACAETGREDPYRCEWKFANLYACTKYIK